MYESFKPFRFYIFEYDGEERHVKFEILAKTPREFDVRFPDFDYIKEQAWPSVTYGREQLLCFLLAYDKKQCYEFIKKLYKSCGLNEEAIGNRLFRVPIFKEFYRKIIEVRNLP